MFDLSLARLLLFGVGKAMKESSISANGIGAIPKLEAPVSSPALMIAADSIEDWDGTNQSKDI